MKEGRKIKYHVFRGVKYKIEFLPPSRVSKGTAYGNCQDPELKYPKMRFVNNIREDAKLRLFLHETLHRVFV